MNFYQLPREVFALLCIVFALVGCSKEKKGYYEGYLELSPAQGKESSTWVAVDVQRTGWNGSIRISDPKTLELLMEPITLSGVYAKSHLLHDVSKIDVQIPALSTTFRLKRSGDCFQGSRSL